jgi:hypothetical protein
MTASDNGAFGSGRRNLLILYDHHEISAKAGAHYLESFYRYSRHQAAYVSSFARCHFDLDYFDAVVLHYSVRVCRPGHLSASFAQALHRYRGLKVLFIQDEYESTAAARQAIRDLGIGLVFTCVPEAAIAKVFPAAQLPGVRFVNVMTGYVPLELSHMKTLPPLRRRPVLIGYRGRTIGFWYGDLGQEKLRIGQRMQEICAARGLVTDIAWDETSRIYGLGWFDFLGRCKATLGTESACNIFDFDGSLRKAIQDEQRRDPQISYEAMRAKYLKDREGEIVMNQVSPKIFEAIACRTALVLFEGTYSGVVEPGRHFLPLKKDFSNVDEVLAKLHDDGFLEAMTERAFADVIESGRYSYQAFMARVDAELERCWRPLRRPAPPWLPLPPCDALPSFRDPYHKNFQAPALKRAWSVMPAFVRALVRRERIERLWQALPDPLRLVLRPIVQKIRSLLKPAH